MTKKQGGANRKVGTKGGKKLQLRRETLKDLETKNGKEVKGGRPIGTIVTLATCGRLSCATSCNVLTC